MRIDSLDPKSDYTVRVAAIRNLPNHKPIAGRDGESFIRLAHTLLSLSSLCQIKDLHIKILNRSLSLPFFHYQTHAPLGAMSPAANFTTLLKTGDASFTIRNRLHTKSGRGQATRTNSSLTPRFFSLPSILLLMLTFPFRHNVPGGQLYNSTKERRCVGHQQQQQRVDAQCQRPGLQPRQQVSCSKMLGFFQNQIFLQSDYCTEIEKKDGDQVYVLCVKVHFCGSFNRITTLYYPRNFVLYEYIFF